MAAPTVQAVNILALLLVLVATVPPVDIPVLVRMVAQIARAVNTPTAGGEIVINVRAASILQVIAGETATPAELVSIQALAGQAAIYARAVNTPIADGVVVHNARAASILHTVVLVAATHA